jgi:3D (Asp-Asp-Asp) domain-containing protein
VRKSLFLALLISFVSSIVPSLPVRGEVLASPVFSEIAMSGQAQASTLSNLPPRPPHPPAYTLRKAQDLGQFKVTFYWLVEEDNYQGKKTCPLYAPGGKLVGRFTPQFIKDFQIESCAMLSDGRIISYLKRSNLCQVVDLPIGANGYTLTELKSVAVDPSVIPIGSRIFIKDAADVLISDSVMHDGIFCAQDVGSAIKGNRIDVYLGPKSNMDLFRSTAMCRTGDVEVYLLQ